MRTQKTPPTRDGVSEGIVPVSWALDKYGTGWRQSPIDDVQLAEALTWLAMDLTEMGEAEVFDPIAHARADHMLRSAEVLLRLAKAKEPEFDDA